MSLLSRLILLGALLTLLVVSYWLFENRKEQNRTVQLRYESFVKKSYSETQATIAHLLALLEAKDISENELLLLFELCLESPKTFDRYIDACLGNQEIRSVPTS